MIYLLYFYIAFTYLFEIGCALAPNGSYGNMSVFADIIGKSRLIGDTLK